MPSLPRRNLLWSVPLTCLGTARADEPYHVGAWYFLRWSSAAPSDAWANLRQSNRRPLIGFYDLAQQSVVDAEICQAANVGIEFLAFYWYRFAKMLVRGAFKRNSGRLWRSAVETTSSEGGMAGRMVRSQEPKDVQTS